MQLRGAASVHGIAVSNLASFLPHVRFTAGGVLTSPESTIWDHADAVVQAYVPAVSEQSILNTDCSRHQRAATPPEL